MQRGDIVVCVLSGDYGKPRPAVVVQSSLFEQHSSVVVCPITSHCLAAPLFRLSVCPTKANHLEKESQIMIDKMMAVKREKIVETIGALSGAELKAVDEALRLWLGL